MHIIIIIIIIIVIIIIIIVIIIIIIIIIIMHDAGAPSGRPRLVLGARCSEHRVKLKKKKKKIVPEPKIVDCFRPACPSLFKFEMLAASGHACVSIGGQVKDTNALTISI